MTHICAVLHCIIFSKLSNLYVCEEPGYASRFSDVFMGAPKGSVGRNGLEKSDKKVYL